LPATIEDTIQVVLELGLNYLWIDRYCIDQDNKLELSHQIALMDVIYGQATITIVAACGEDPSHGFRRITQHPKHYLERIVGNVRFFEEPWPSDIFDPIVDSRWFKRAWTYQEAVFSRSRLFFTDEVVYFDCLTSSGMEDFKFEYVEPMEDYQEDYQVHPIPQPFLGPGTGQVGAIQHIEAFSKRVLGHPEDVIRAASGILHAFEADLSISHLWGIPMIPEPPEYLDIRKSQWTPVMSFLLGLQWILDDDRGHSHGKRRRFGPSWSWAGWEDGCSWVSDSAANTNPMVKFQVELMDGSISDWEAYLTHDKITRQSLASPFVHLTAWVTRVQVKPVGDHSNRYELAYTSHRHEVAFTSSGSGKRFTFTFRMDNPIGSTSQPQMYEAIHLSPSAGNVVLEKNPPFEKSSLPAFLIVRSVHDWFERVGLAILRGVLTTDHQDHSNDSDGPCLERKAGVYDSYSQMPKTWKTMRLG
jgi:hypothetical protein